LSPSKENQLSRSAELFSVLLVVFSLSSVGLISLNKINKLARDNIRVGDLNYIALALEMYYNDNKVYPGESGANQWSVLPAALNDKYISLVPSDSKKNVYEYWVSDNGQKYVLNATLELSEEYALRNDLDGKVFGCDCDDEFGGESGWEYCLTR